jgi:outer membrane biosynthesis protein TonB
MRRTLAITLLSSSLTLTAAAATGPSVDVSASTAPDGVTSPRLVFSKPITISSDELPKAYPNPARVVLKFDLDQTGSPRNLRVSEALTQPVDARVMAAVRDFRWTPAVINNHVVPIEMTLIVNVQH